MNNMNEYILKAGTILKFKNIPVELKEDIVVKSNTDLTKLQLKGYGEVEKDFERNPHSNN